jgi:hypothetical protein
MAGRPSPAEQPISWHTDSVLADCQIAAAGVALVHFAASDKARRRAGECVGNWLPSVAFSLVCW